MKGKKRVIRKRFGIDGLQAAREYAESVNRILKRRAAIVSEISRLHYTDHGPEERFEYYEVCFDTWSKREW